MLEARSVRGALAAESFVAERRFDLVIVGHRPRRGFGVLHFDRDTLGCLTESRAPEIQDCLCDHWRSNLAPSLAIGKLNLTDRTVGARLFVPPAPGPPSTTAATYPKQPVPETPSGGGPRRPAAGGRSRGA